MNESMAFADDVLDRLRERYPRYRETAYLFILAALHHVLEQLPHPRHISGPELADGVRELAIHRFGPMARTVLQHWGIERTDDMGEIVFALVEAGILLKQDEDSPSDFEALYDFEDVFEADYPWGASI